MRIPRLYSPQPLNVGQTVNLSDSAFNHAVRVLRLKAGAPLILFDGRGGEYRAVLDNVGKRRADARVAAFDPRETESPLRVTLVQGISRGERMDYTLQKAVELGVDAIQPVFTRYGQVSLDGARLDKRLRHWQGVMLGACEQCGRNRPPPLLAPLPLSDWLPKLSGQGLMLDPGAAHTLSGLPPPAGPVTLLVGPEGGLSEAEGHQAVAAGFVGLRLGPRVLRTETAGIVALTALQVLWGDLGR